MASRYFDRRLFLKATASSGLLMTGLSGGAAFDGVTAIRSFRLDHLADFVGRDHHFASKWYAEICRACGQSDLRSFLQFRIFDDFDNSRIEFVGPYLVSDTEVNIFNTQEALNGSESVKEGSTA